MPDNLYLLLPRPPEESTRGHDSHPFHSQERKRMITVIRAYIEASSGILFCVSLIAIALLIYQRRAGRVINREADVWRHQISIAVTANLMSVIFFISPLLIGG